MSHLENVLKGGDLRFIGRSDEVVSGIKSQQEFDELFRLLSHADRKIVMRAADAIEKITVAKQDYLDKHKRAIIHLTYTAENKELKWHLALLLPRLSLSEEELQKTWGKLADWAQSNSESRIVRVNSLQGLFALSQQHVRLRKHFLQIVGAIEKENIPSLNARIKKLKLK